MKREIGSCNNPALLSIIFPFYSSCPTASFILIIFLLRYIYIRFFFLLLLHVTDFHSTFTTFLCLTTLHSSLTCFFIFAQVSPKKEGRAGSKQSETAQETCILIDAFITINLMAPSLRVARAGSSTHPVHPA